MEETYPKDFESVLEKVNRVITDESFRNKAILENMTIKKSYMEGDEFDLGRRNLLNYGHCFGHALETSSNYYVPHGIAVNIGMAFANFIAKDRGLISDEVLEFVNCKILLPNIPLKLRPTDFDTSILLDSMKNDKKRTGKYLSVIIPGDEFKMLKVDDVKDVEFEKALNNLRTLFFKD